MSGDFRCACGCGCKNTYSNDSAYCWYCTRGMCGEDEPEAGYDSDCLACGAGDCDGNCILDSLESACLFCGAVNCDDRCCITCGMISCPCLTGQGDCPDWPEY